MDIVLATLNVHKLREFRDLLKSVNRFDVLSMHNFPHYSLPPQEENSFKERAIAKAVHAAQELKKWVLADDSGLIVPSLNGAPGIYSKYYAGDEATDAENRRKLLEALKGKTGLERSAYFECCLALAGPDGLKKCVTGRCEGMVSPEERGRHGFGYDAIFIKHDYDKTFSELDDAVRNRISHRRKAFEKISIALETI